MAAITITRSCFLRRCTWSNLEVEQICKKPTTNWTNAGKDRRNGTTNLICYENCLVMVVFFKTQICHGIMEDKMLEQRREIIRMNAPQKLWSFFWLITMLTQFTWLSCVLIWIICKGGGSFDIFHVVAILL